MIATPVKSTAGPRTKPPGVIMTTAVLQDDIVETAIKSGSFPTLVAAIKAGGLAETLKGKGPFTVFAPNEAAFAKLPKATLDDLMKPENKANLASLLSHHVVSGKILSRDIVGKTMKSKSVQGAELSIDAMKDVMINKAKVVKSDIETSNGVIHVIDTVLTLPSS
jgi:uncharacterized surface protein with fasciclin (FAS1) repeats